VNKKEKKKERMAEAAIANKAMDRRENPTNKGLLSCFLYSIITLTK
jgi:hypothetical protein